MIPSMGIAMRYSEQATVQAMTIIAQKSLSPWSDITTIPFGLPRKNSSPAVEFLALLLVAAKGLVEVEQNAYSCAAL
jgi:hypothetical protein